MKNYLYVFLIMLISNIELYSQDYCFGSRIGSKTYDYGKTIVALPDKHLILGGNTGAGNFGGGNIHLIKVDTLSNIVWSKIYGSPQSEDLTGMVILQNQFIYGCGNTNSVDGNQWNIFLAKWDTAGNLMWIKTYGSYAWEYSNAIVLSSDTHLLIAGYTYNNPNGKQDMYILKLDTAGNKVWEKTFGFAGSDDFANDLAEDTSGRVLIAGNTDIAQNGIFNPYYLMVDLNNGDSLMALIQNEDSISILSSVIYDTSANTFISVYNSTKQSNEYKAYIQQRDMNLNLINEFWTGIANINTYMQQIFSFQPGYITVTGYAENYGYGNDEGVYYTFMTNGTFITSGAEGGLENDRFLSATNIPGLGIFMVGFSEEPSVGLSDFMLVKTYSNGNYFNCQDYVIVDTSYQNQTPVLNIESLSETSVKIYPNPFNERIYVDVPNLLDKPNISVYSPSGQLLYYTPFVNRPTVQLNTGHWPPGMYILELGSLNDVQRYKLIKP